MTSSASDYINRFFSLDFQEEGPTLLVRDPEGNTTAIPQVKTAASQPPDLVDGELWVDTGFYPLIVKCFERSRLTSFAVGVLPTP